MQALDPGTLGAAIRRRRERRGLGLLELARAAGYSRITLWRMETGRSKRPSIEALRRTARALGTTLAALLKAAENG